MIESENKQSRKAEVSSGFSGYIQEDGKTFYQRKDGTLRREHDDNFFGPRFEHKRCPFCGRITSMHVLHWSNHLSSCAPPEYSWIDIADLRYKRPDELSYKRLGR